LDKREQIGIDLLGMDNRHAVREAGVDLELSIPYQLGRERSCVCTGHDLIIVTVHDERRNVDLHSGRR
jgi:hypothetical protein